jgi:hypothetical protein
MMTLPKDLYCIRHKTSYFGFNGHTNKNIKSLVFGFVKEQEVSVVYELVKRSKRFPSMTLDAKKRIVIHKLPSRGIEHDLDINDLVIVMKDSEDFIINNAVNGVDTCVISSIENVKNFITINNYYITKIHETPKELYQQNLNALFKLPEN